MQNRRAFLNKLGLGCAHVGATTLLSGITSLNMIGTAAAANRSWVTASSAPYKALVCILLAGGNDSFNMLVPTEDEPYNDYAATRTNIAIPKANLLPINPSNTDGKKFGLHPSMTKIQSLFEAENAAFIANCGVLERPTTQQDFLNKYKLPNGLFSHPHQQTHWQTGLPTATSKQGGWAGRMADLLQENNQNQSISMSLSLAGTNIFQRGNEVLPMSLKNSANGISLINGSTDFGTYEQLKRTTIDNIVNQDYQNIFKKAYSNMVQGSKGNSLAFDAAIAAGTPITTAFEADNLAQDLKMVARTIGARDQLNVENQVFFVLQSQYDTHDNNLENHGILLNTLDKAVGSFYEALEELNMQDSVTLFTMSDFGRKLQSNGDGTDHAWGGNSFVVGGGVQGKKIYGDYPSLNLNNNSLIIDDSRMLPTTSVDEYFAELALWFGVSSADLAYVLPNIGNFWTPSSNSGPLGFLL